MKKFMRKGLLALLILIVLVGCTAVSRESDTETPTSATQTVATTPTSTSEPSPTSPPRREDRWTADQAAIAAEQQLADRLNVDAGEIRQVIVEPETWPDACLGLEIEGQACAEVQTPGYRVLLEANDEICEYRTDELGTVRFAGSPNAWEPSSTPARTPTATSQASTVPAFRLIEKGVKSVATGGSVVKGQVFDRQGDVIANGRAAVGVTVDGVYLQSSGFRNPQPTNAEGWYEIYVRPNQRIRIVHLLIDGQEVPLAGTSMSWVATDEGWWHVNIRQIGGSFPPNTPTPAQGEPTATPTRAGVGRAARVLANALNVRRGPGTGYAAISVVQRGDRLLVLGQDASGNWLYVRLEDGAEGWVARAFTDFTPSLSDTPIPPPATPTETPAPARWRGEYYDNADLRGSPTLVRYDEEIDFDWGSLRPAPELPRDNFSVRWTRTADFPSGTYRFTVESDDGVRVWIDGGLVIDQWHDAAGKTYTVQTFLSSGTHSVRVEYYEHWGLAYIDFDYERISEGPS